jgi:hypothetical protein
MPLGRVAMTEAVKAFTVWIEHGQIEAVALMDCPKEAHQIWI